MACKAFTDVEFRSEHTPASVAEHEIFMSFNNDSDALAFEHWWHARGAIEFQKYLDKQEGR